MSSNNETQKLKEQIDLLTKELNMLRASGTAELSVIMIINDNCSQRDAIDTLVAQVYSSYEVICMYSGASDEVLTELKQYQAHNSNFTVYRSDTVSGIENLKNALEFARGNYVMVLSPYTWLSSDHALSDLMSMIKDSELDAVFAKNTIFKTQDTESEILSSCVCTKKYMTEAVSSCGDLKYYFQMPLFTYLKNGSQKTESADDVITVTKVYNAGINDKYYCGMFYEYQSDEADMILDYLASAYWLMTYFRNNNMLKEYSAVYCNLINNWLDAVTGSFSIENNEMMSLISKINSLTDKDIIGSEEADEEFCENDIYVRMIDHAKKK